LQQEELEAEALMKVVDLSLEVKQMFRKLLQHRLTVRILLVAVFVAVSHLYDWLWLRALTTATLVQISEMLGVSMHRTAVDIIRVAGISAKFVVSCTMIDAFLGAIPLLWRTTVSWTQNLLRLAVVAVGVFGLNIFRLELGFIAMTKGAPWWLAHEVVAGLTYFCLYLFIVKQRAWDTQPPQSSEARRGTIPPLFIPEME
jgi:hypothetical protein